MFLEQGNKHLLNGTRYKSRNDAGIGLHTLRASKTKNAKRATPRCGSGPSTLSVFGALR